MSRLSSNPPRRLAWLWLLMVYGSAVLGGPATHAGDQAPAPRQYAPTREVDILHLAIDFTPDFKMRSLTGTTSLRFKPLARPVQKVTLDAVDLRVTRVTASEAVASWQNDDRQLTVAFAAPLPADRETTLSISYSAEPTQGLYFRTPEMGYPPGDTHLFSQGESISHRHWFPCFDAPNEKMTSEVTCRVPEGMVVLSNGRLLSETKDAATGLIAHHWLQDKPHVNYLIAVAAGHFRQLEDRHGEVPLTFHTPPSEFAWAESSFRDTRDMMAYFEDEIGVPYPWARYAQVCVQDFVAGGMENTTMTILTDGTLFPPETENIRSSQGLVAHELVHQWFGDLVTCKDWSHLWLNEGFATYYEALYDRHRNGRDEFLWNMWEKGQGVLDQANDTIPIVWRGFTSPDEQFSFRAYPKGAWVLHMLRSELGEDLYRRCVKTFLERHAFDNVETDDFKDVIEELSGRPFDRFFDQWVYHAGAPTLEASYSWDESTRLARLAVRQTHAVSDKVLLFQVTLPVRFALSAGAVDRQITVKEKEEDFYFALPEMPQGVRLDPELTLLARIRFTPPANMVESQLTNQTDLIGRILAVRTLGGRKDKESVTRLGRALNSDPFYAVRIEASRALRGLRTDEALDALLAGTDQTDARVRRQVREDLRGFYRPRVLESTMGAINTERNPDVLRELISTLGPYGSEATRELLLRFLGTPSFRNTLADAAVGAMRAQDDPAFIAPLLEALRSRPGDFVGYDFAQGLTALAHLARNEEDKTAVREFLAAQTTNPRLSVRRAALSALGTLGDSKATALLETFGGRSQDDGQRRAAEEALNKLRANRRPVDEFRTLRDEIEGFRKENRSLREQFETLQRQFKEFVESKNSTNAPAAVKDPARPAKKARQEKPKKSEKRHRAE